MIPNGTTFSIKSWPHGGHDFILCGTSGIVYQDGKSEVSTCTKPTVFTEVSVSTFGTETVVANLQERLLCPSVLHIEHFI